MLYFAYGSNMSSKRFKTRAQSAQSIAIARLSHHQLKFHKKSLADGSAKCDAFESGVAAHFIYGVVYEIAEHEKSLLDKVEGLGKGYEIKTTYVQFGHNELVEVFLYYATHIEANLKPFHWYREHVLQGALEHHLPLEYIEGIKSVRVMNDLNEARTKTELQIYSCNQ